MPIDCWLGVLDYLEELSDLATISAVSRDLHALTLPLLYKTISWEWDSVSLSRILRLLRTVIQNPNLAQFIQHITLLSARKNVDQHNWDNEKVQDNSRWKNEISRFKDVMDLAQGVIKKAEFPEGAVPKWNNAIEDGNAYALATILLSQLHNLVSVRLDYTFVWQSGFPGLMLQHALFSAPNGTMSKFAHLATIDYGSNVPIAEEEEPMDNHFPEGYPSCDPGQFMAWFHLPSVASISMWLRNFQDAISSPKQLEQVHTLVLARSTLADQEVYDLLQHTPNLKLLHLGLAYKISPALDDPHTLLDALESVRHTLEVLSMGVEYYPLSGGSRTLNSNDWWCREAFQGFLKMFPHIRSAEIPITVLLGVFPEEAPDIKTVLTGSLEELCLQWDSQDMFGQTWDWETNLLDRVRELLVDLRSHSPKLKRVVIRQMAWFPEQHEDYEEKREELGAECALAGVDFQVVCDWLSPGLWTYKSR